MPVTNHVYHGVKYEFYGTKSSLSTVTMSGNLSALDTVADNLVESNLYETVVNMTMIPADFASDSGSGMQVFTKTMVVPSTVNGYEPRNKKLLTYPFTFAVVDAGGDALAYRYEWADSATHGSAKGGELSFGMWCAMSPNPVVSCAPYNYNGSSTREGTGLKKVNMNHSVSLSGFPQCAFPIDSYRAWLAQTAGGKTYGIQQDKNVLAGITGTGAALLATIRSAKASGHATEFGKIATTSLLVGTALSTINAGLNVQNTAVQSEIEQTRGRAVRISQDSANDIASGNKDIFFKEVSITAYNAKIIDAFFDRYGYAVNRNKIPNRNARKHWSYVKTSICNIDGNVPADDLEKIKSIYNNGITFWTNGSEVGEYSLAYDNLAPSR